MTAPVLLDDTSAFTRDHAGVEFGASADGLPVARLCQAWSFRLHHQYKAFCRP